MERVVYQCINQEITPTLIKFANKISFFIHLKSGPETNIIVQPV